MVVRVKHQPIIKIPFTVIKTRMKIVPVVIETSWREFIAT